MNPKPRTKDRGPRTTAVVFPFDLFGNAGTGAGAKLLGDALREVIEDTAAETRPTRADAHRGRLRVKEFAFDTPDQVAGWRDTGRRAVRGLLRRKEFALWLAGNHLGVLPVYDELGPETLVIQLDAHLDMYNLHDTTGELSHGNFLMHVEGERPRVVNVGHRDLFLTPRHVGKYFETVVPAAALTDAATDEVRSLAAGAERVWIDLDADVFDPAVCPAVHQPMPFGPAPLDVLKLVAAVWSDRVAGVSVSEFDPGRDVRDASLNLLGWFLEWVLLKRHENG